MIAPMDHSDEVWVVVGDVERVARIVALMLDVMPAKAYHMVVAHDAIPSHRSSLLVFWPRL